MILRAARFGDVTDGRSVHAGCGGLVLADAPDHTQTHLKCRGCGRVWKKAKLVDWSDQRIGEMFLIEAPADPVVYRLVETTSGKTRFTRMVAYRRFG